MQRGILVLLVGLFCAHAQTTTFTFHGQLAQGGQPANGWYDLRFSLFDALEDGNEVAGPLTNAATYVSNGVFVAHLDFGSAVFTGADRWLAISVRTNGSGSGYDTLAPRQQITATPYAIRAANFGGAISDAQLSSNVARLDGNQTFTGVVNFTSGSNLYSGTFAGNGSALSNINFAAGSSGAIRAGSAGMFVLQHTFAVPSDKSGLRAGDLNRDGYPDIVLGDDSAVGNTAIVTVMTNHSTGRFAFSQSIIVPMLAHKVSIADMNGDGRMDVLVTGFTNIPAPGLLVILTNNGAGVVRALSTNVLGTTTFAHTTADVNGDGRLDVITVDRDSRNLSVLTNNGTGRVTLAATLPTGPLPWDVVAADFTRDGRVDIASADSGTNTLSVYTNAGGSSFGRAASPFVNTDVRALFVADLNRDGHADLVASGAARTLLTNDGSGTFSTAVLPNSGTILQAADLNGDGSPDLVDNSGPSLHIGVLTNGPAGFVLADTPYVGASRSDTTLADVNRDGWPDLLALTEEGVAVLINAPAQFRGTFPDGLATEQVTAGQALDFVVSGTSALRIVDGRPDQSAPNIIGGYFGNVIAPTNTGGNVISGGGWSGGINSIGNNSRGNFIGAGSGNTITEWVNDSAIVGGNGNLINGSLSFIGGGADNISNSNRTVIAGGGGNRIYDTYGTIGGGGFNSLALGTYGSTIAGGYVNSISTNSSYSAIGGGTGNQILANVQNGTIPGGQNNVVAGSGSMAAGRNARANHSGSFVWGDNQGLLTSSSAANQFIIRAGGGMGVNTTSPSASMLEVRTTNLTGAAIRFGFHTGGAGHLIGGPSRVALATDDVVERISIAQGNGNVGIGTLPSGTYKLEVNGSAHRVDNASTWTVASDARLKKNIHSISGALDKLLALRGVTFEYTSGDTNAALAGERLGFIAQQVEKVFPAWVGSDVDGYKNVTTSGVEALLVEALRDLRAEKDAKIAELQKQNELLEKRLQRLERVVTKNE